MLENRISQKPLTKKQFWEGKAGLICRSRTRTCLWWLVPSWLQSSCTQ